MATPVVQNPVIINPTMTLAGQAAAFNAHNTGIELILDGVSFGLAHYKPDGNELALRDPVGSKIPLAGGSRPTPYQLRMAGVWAENVGQVPIGEIGYWAGNTLVFVWSMEDGSVAGYKTDGVAYVLFNDLAFGQVPAGSVSLVIDPTESVALAALAAHEGSSNAHPQYMLRADMAKDSGPLAWLGNAAGTANALTFSLTAAESELPDYAAGQRFQFLAVAQNTGAVTVNIEGRGVKNIKKAGETGLVDLEAGDIKPGAAYDLNYDGTNFQLGGGVGGGKAFERYSFTASVAQAVFSFPHVPGSIIALRNGRETTDFTSAKDGSKVTLKPAANLGDSLEFLCFKSFHIVDTYTKTEVQALLQTAGSLPVGTMLPFPRGTVPAGFLEVDGSTFSADVYPDLAAYLGGTTLPESRGEFLRGWDHGRGVDAGRAIGTWQADDNKSHTHTTTRMPSFNNASGTQTIGVAIDNGTSATSTGFDRGINPSGGTEARPRNLAVMWCIKAWAAPINQGQLDVAALVKELDKMKSAIPVGAVLAFPTGAVPIGYLELDGSVKSIAAYPDLAAYLGTTFNKGDEGAGNFRLPESRGEFLRGWDHGRGIDTGRAIGTWQKGSGHSFDQAISAGIVGDRTAATDAAIGRADLGYDAANIADYPAALNMSAGGTSAAITSGGEISFGSTRPRNLSVMWCIKAWAAPANQGQIDVAALAVLASQANEGNQGTAKVASSAQMFNDDDSVMVTPRKLRLGLSYLFAQNGYIALPAWLGGFILQWGRASYAPAIAANTELTLTVAYPVSFPNASYIQLASCQEFTASAGGGTSNVVCNARSATTSLSSLNINFRSILAGVANSTIFNFFAIGR
ncbi:phage tail protein [Pseudomonas viridiflava]|uniref:phage tail protein n=4 Tax=Pseudomonas viridiflava TaxID=33069 RepID=UPI001F11B9F0|nr:phage tail protein [Pseudomonas viridiflava]